MRKRHSLRKISKCGRKFVNPESIQQNPFFHDSNPLLNSNDNIIIIWKSACRPAKTRPLINSPSQNEIVGRFPGRVHSLVVRLFPVWTPSQTHTTVIVIDLCGVNGLVAVHWPNLFETRQVGNMTRPFKRTTTIYRNPSVPWTSGQTFRPFVPCHF